MSYSREQVIQALENVFYPGTSNDIIGLNMVDDLQVEGKKISFTLVFERPDDAHAKLLRKACVNVLAMRLGKEVEVKGNIKLKTRAGQPISEEEHALPGVKNVIAVASGKGGVGKSTVAANLAIALARTGAKVGLLDADIYGPSVPIMFDLQGAKPEVVQEGEKVRIMPVEKYGLKVLSIGFFVEQDKALLWRGPMASNALTQLFNDAEWGELDFMVIDLPPGTGDIHLTLVQQIPVTGVAIVSTPQQVALADARKAVSMFKQDSINVPILGLIENMAYFTPAELPENKYYIFGKEGGKALAAEYNINFLGQIPLVQGICESGDAGKPIALDEQSPVCAAFNQLAQNVITYTEQRNDMLPPTQKVVTDPNAQGCGA